MLARIRKSMEEKDQGFTLIELLVVIIIIGILAAIAIPVFLNQRKKAVDASMKSDLKTVANAEETYFTDNQVYLAVSSTATPSVGDAVSLSNGNLAAVSLGTSTNAGAYCVEITRASGAQAGGRTSWVYKSNAGGIQTATGVTCSGF